MQSIYMIPKTIDQLRKLKGPAIVVTRGPLYVGGVAMAPGPWGVSQGTRITSIQAMAKIPYVEPSSL